MHTPSHKSSTRVIAALRRYVLEHKTSAAYTKHLQAFLESVKVSQPKVAEGEEPGEPVTLAMVLAGNYPKIDGYTPVLRIGNKFGSRDKVKARIDSYQGQITECQNTMRSCRDRLIDLLGKRDAERVIRERTRAA